MPLSLLCWNVLADCHITEDWYPGVPRADLRGDLRRERLVAALARSEVDVLVLQEVEPGLLPALRRVLPGHGVAWCPHNGEGLAVLVRGPTPFSHVLPLPGGRKSALLVRLPGGLTLANVHLSYTGPEAGPGRRGLAQLEAVLDHGPDLICGDFNAEIDWPERRRAHDRGYVELGPVGPTCAIKGYVQSLDAVLARPGITGRADALPRLGVGDGLPSPAMPSDHLPLRIFDVALSAGVGGARPSVQTGKEAP